MQTSQLVLIVDDHREAAELIAEFLRECGFAALTASTGLDALRLYDTQRPSLVITDQGLRDGISGSDLLRTLRRKYGPAVGRALFLTGSPELVDCGDGDMVLEKPVGLDELLAAVRAALEGLPAARQAH